jgi:hypothetical protein
MAFHTVSCILVFLTIPFIQSRAFLLTKKKNELLRATLLILLSPYRNISTIHAQQQRSSGVSAVAKALGRMMPRRQDMIQEEHVSTMQRPTSARSVSDVRQIMPDPSAKVTSPNWCAHMLYHAIYAILLRLESYSEA